MGAPALLLISAVLHATWNAATKTSRDKDVFVLLTISLSCVFVAAAWVIAWDGLTIGGAAGLGYALLAGLFEAGYLIALAKGFARASLAKAYSIMRGGAMVLVWASSLLLSLEPLNAITLAGSAIVIAGIILTGLSGPPGPTQLKPAERSAAGSELTWPLIAAVFIAGYHLCYGESLRLGAEPKALFVIAVATALPSLFVANRRDLIARSARIFSEEAGKLAISSVGAGLGFLIFLYGLRVSGPGYAITLRNSSIFFSIGLAFLIRDRMTRFQLVGATVIGLGAILLSHSGH